MSRLNNEGHAHRSAQVNSRGARHKNADNEGHAHKPAQVNNRGDVVPPIGLKSRIFTLPPVVTYVSYVSAHCRTMCEEGLRLRLCVFTPFAIQTANFHSNLVQATRRAGGHTLPFTSLPLLAGANYKILEEGWLFWHSVQTIPGLESTRFQSSIFQAVT
jgi:hypothetical protein